MTSLATALMSTALFARRSRAGWLDELDEIRGTALISPHGEVDLLMEPVDSLAATGLDGEIAWDDRSELDDLAPAPHRVNPAEMWHPEVAVPGMGTGTDGDQDRPAEEVLEADDLLPSDHSTGFRFSAFSTGDGLHVDDGLAGGRSWAADATELTLPAPVGEPTEPKPEPVPGLDLEPEPASRPMSVDDDGTVVLRAGILRVEPGVVTSVRQDSERIQVELPSAWCWATLGDACEPVTVSLPSGTVTLEPGTTALVTVEDDASAFVAVASGRAVLEQAHGSTPLSARSVALVPVGGLPQVDRASVAEIDADPLVAHNRDLDTRL